MKTFTLKELKWKLQRLFRGYADEDLWNFCDFAIWKIRKPFKAFVRQQEVGGAGCPEEFWDKNTKDCNGWIEALKKMESAMDLMIEHNSEKYFNKTQEQILEEEKKIKEGMDLFGKHFRSLWD